MGLTTEEAKLLAWDHNNDNDYRQKMSSIERIRIFHHEYLDAKDRTGGTKLKLVLRRQCLHEVGIVVDDNVKSDVLRKYLGSNLRLEMGMFGTPRSNFHNVGK